MSQPCSLVELLLIDARVLDAPPVRELVDLARGRGIPRGCLSVDGHAMDAVIERGMSEMFDFWLDGDGSGMPLERALGLLVVEPARVLVITEDAPATDAVLNTGMQAGSPTEPGLERRLG